MTPDQIMQAIADSPERRVTATQLIEQSGCEPEQIYASLVRLDCLRYAHPMTFNGRMWWRLTVDGFAQFPQRSDWESA